MADDGQSKGYIGPHWKVISKDGKQHTIVIPTEDSIIRSDMPANCIVATAVRFYSHTDESFFFNWINNIHCIKKFALAHNKIYLDLIDQPLMYEDMKDLIALCHRYNIDMKQLAAFCNEDNKAAFEPWKKKIFKKDNKHAP